MLRRTVAPLFIGSLLLRMNSGAATIVLGLLLARSSTHAGHLVTSVHVGLLAVVFYITELVLAPVFGALSDRWGRRGFLMTGPLFGLFQVSLLIFTPMQNPLLYLLALQVVAGFSGAMTTPAILGYLADLTVQNRSYRMRIMSFFELVTSGGIALGTILGGFAWERLEHNAFLLLAAGYLLVTICMFFSPVVSQVVERGGAKATIQRYWLLLRIPRLFIFIPAWISIMALVGIWLSSQLTFLLTRPDTMPHQLLMGIFSGPDAGRHISLILGAFVFFFGLSLLFWASSLNRVPRLRLMFTSIGGIYLSCVVLFCINHFGVVSFWLMLLLIPLLLLGIFVETGFAPAALAYLADISESAAKDRGLVMGLYSIFLGLGQIIGNGLGGLFATRFGFDGLIYLTALLASVALLSLFWLFRRQEPG